MLPIMGCAATRDNSAMSLSAAASTVSLKGTPPLRRVLAIDTSTERMSVALADLLAWDGTPGEVTPHLWCFDGEGGAQASSTLIPTVLSLLRQAGWQLADLDAIALGIGPGAFTGLRTACAVVQGLAFSARPGGIPVLPMGTLHAVAEEARWQLVQEGMHAAAPGGPPGIVALLDARMDECYAARFALTPDGEMHPVGPPVLRAPEALADVFTQQPGSAPWEPGTVLAGNAMAVYGARLPLAWQQARHVPAGPTATAMLRLATALWQAGGAVAAADAQPLYVRDKVAQTTEERALAQAEKAEKAKNTALTGTSRA